MIGAGDLHRRIGAVGAVDGDDQLGGIVAVDREVGRLAG